jgi:hypothetical protein
VKATHFAVYTGHGTLRLVTDDETNAIAWASVRAEIGRMKYRTGYYVPMIEVRTGVYRRADVAGGRS